LTYFIGAPEEKSGYTIYPILISFFAVLFAKNMDFDVVCHRRGARFERFVCYAPVFIAKIKFTGAP
jgi:hypothetical protein